MRARIVVVMLACSALSMSSERSARAQGDAASCTAAYESTQRLRKAGKLRAADEQSKVCAASSCASWIRKDCVAWHDEIVATTPTLSVSAVGPDGCDLVRARLVIDGVVIAEQLDGRATLLDPGTHSVRVVPATGAPVEREVLVAEGQKNRPLVLRLAPEGVVCGAPPPPPPAKQERVVPQEAEGTSPLVYLFGGIGLASLGVGGAFEISGLSRQNTLDDCRPRCESSDVDRMRTTYFVGDLLVGIGVVSLGVATVLYFTGRSSTSSAATTTATALRRSR